MISIWHPCERLGNTGIPTGRRSWALHPGGLFGRATAFPSALSLAASWNKNLAEKQEQCMLRNGVQEVFIFLEAPGVNNYPGFKGSP